MKRLLAILLFLSLCNQYTAKLGIIAWYEINKDYIAKNLCENRDKPQLKCCGKCVLKRQLQKADENNTDTKQLPGSKSEKESIPVFIASAQITYGEFISVKEASVYCDYYHSSTGYDPLVSVFHPPSYC